MVDGGDGRVLFETKERGSGRIWWALYACSVFAGLLLMLLYRATHFPQPENRGGGRWWARMGMFGSELWFGFYWVLTLAVRWNPTHRYTFKQRLCQRFADKLPNIDAFVCTADPAMEPPAMVISTVLSVMAYEYPAEKLSVYLSDDGGSELPFYALLML